MQFWDIDFSIIGSNPRLGTGWVSGKNFITHDDFLVFLRLAKKKAKAEAKKRELEAAQKMEEERLLAKHKVVGMIFAASTKRPMRGRTS